MKNLSFNDQLDKASARGQVTVNHARGVRKAHRRTTKPGSGKRQKDIAYAITKINHAMRELRQLIGKLPWEVHSPAKAERVRTVSRELQYERRQLKKMRRSS